MYVTQQSLKIDHEFYYIHEPSQFFVRHNKAERGDIDRN